MPELAEVEFGRKVAHEVVSGRCISTVECEDDPIVFDGVAPDVIRKALEGAAVLGTRRHGKYIWFELDRHPWPVFHFGMTGAFRTPGDVPIELEGGFKEDPDQWPPRFAKISLRMEDGRRLAMTNARRLGRILLRQNPDEEPPISDLGFDPLNAMPELDGFREQLRRRKVTLKGLLLDQKFSAGVGNWLADEILYQARLDPRRRANALSPEEEKRAWQQMSRVVEKAVAVDARKDAFPKGWLFHRRWGKEKDAKTVKGDIIEHITVAGRTTAWVPAVQK